MSTSSAFTVLLSALVILNASSSVRGNTTLKVDCEKKEIELTCHIVLSDNFTAADKTALENAIAKFWNPTPPLMYYNCKVVVKLHLVTKKELDALKNKKKEDLTEDEKRLLKEAPFFDKWDVSQGGGVAGGGGTLHTGEGNRPGTSHRVGLSRDDNGQLKPETISHELGHCLGIDDPAPTDKWDKNGIQPAHIREIIRRGSVKHAGEWRGWRPKVTCCETEGADADWAKDEKADENAKEKHKKKAKDE